MFNTIKRKIFIVLLSFVFCTVIISAIAFNYFVRQRDSLSEINQKSENIQMLLLRDMHVMHQFFESETINPEFFETGKSGIITTHRGICENIIRSCEELNAAQKINALALGDSIVNLKLSFLVYTEMVDNMIRQILKRGFKDYGVEGNMRGYAHKLETNSETIGLINILQLRRHEKDFIIRQEENYVLKHAALVKKIKSELGANTQKNEQKKFEVLQTLTNYNVEFVKLVSFEKKLGLRNYGGLKKEMDTKCISIESSLSLLQEVSEKKVNSAIFKMELFYIFLGLVFILASLLPIVFISRKVSRSFQVTDANEDNEQQIDLPNQGTNFKRMVSAI